MGMDSWHKHFTHEPVQRQLSRVPEKYHEHGKSNHCALDRVKNSGFRDLCLTPDTATDWLHDKGQSHFPKISSNFYTKKYILFLIFTYSNY